MNQFIVYVLYIVYYLLFIINTFKQSVFVSGRRGSVFNKNNVLRPPEHFLMV